MSGRYLLCFTFLLLSSEWWKSNSIFILPFFVAVCLADHHFICTANSVCAGEAISCNCTSDNDTDSFMWSVRNPAGMVVESSGWLNSTNNQATIRIRDATFIFSYNSTTLSMGRIATSPGINNYTLVCSRIDENDTVDDSPYLASFNISCKWMREFALLSIIDFFHSCYVTAKPKLSNWIWELYLLFSDCQLDRFRWLLLGWLCPQCYKGRRSSYALSYSRLLI